MVMIMTAKQQHSSMAKGEQAGRTIEYSGKRGKHVKMRSGGSTVQRKGAQDKRRWKGLSFPVEKDWRYWGK
jgi:hypothetical protein